MGYSGGSLADIAPEAPLLEAAYRTTDRAGAELLRLVKHHTPVAKPPPGVWAEWLASRGRMPGTLRESWRRSDVVVAGVAHRFGIDVYTNDPVAPHVEYPTMPHLIYPKSWRGPNARLRFWDAGGMVVFAYLVHHPGTHGSFMVAKSLAELEVLWQEIARDELERWAAETQARI